MLSIFVLPSATDKAIDDRSPFPFPPQSPLLCAPVFAFVRSSLCFDILLPLRNLAGCRSLSLSPSVTVQIVFVSPEPKFFTHLSLSASAFSSLCRVSMWDCSRQETHLGTSTYQDIVANVAIKHCTLDV